jgi:hypothetical protein
MTKVDLWREIRSDFEGLFAEECAAVPDPRDELRLRAYGAYQAGKSDGVGSWQMNDGPSADFRARFEETAARAGSALDPPDGVAPVDFWLHRVFLDLLEQEALRNDRGHLAVGQKDQGGIIREICKASTTYCTRLMKAATECEVQARGSLSHKGVHNLAKFPTPDGMDWADITIRVTSDTRVQIHVGPASAVLTFEEMGFGDQRSEGKGPRRAWSVLLSLAENGGRYEIPKLKGALGNFEPSKGPSREAKRRERQEAQEYVTGKKRTAVETRVGEIRARLRHLFGIEGDPLPFVKEGDWFGYKALFKIKCAESFYR